MDDLADPGAPGRLGQPHRADDVDRRIELGFLHRAAHVDLRGQVVDDFGLVLLEQADQIGAGDVRLDELEPVVGAGLGEVLGAAPAQIVEPDDGVAVREQAIHQRRTDEAGRPRDQYLHGGHPTVR